MKIYIAALLISLFTGVSAMAEDSPKNVLGTPLKSCCDTGPVGFYRDGYCRTGPDDKGVHVVAATVTQAFLDYTKSQGNDLQTPVPQYGFKGLKPGDKWCLCAARWREAEQAGVAPPVDLNATHEKALNYIPIDTLKKYQQ